MMPSVNTGKALVQLTQCVLRGDDGEAVQQLLHGVDPVERAELLRAPLPSTGVAALLPPGVSPSQQLRALQLTERPEPCTLACLAAALGHRQALLALLNADPASLGGNAAALTPLVLQAAGHGQAATLGVLAGFNPTTRGRLELRAGAETLKEVLMALDPDAAALQLVQWLKTPGDAAWTALRTAALTDFVASVRNREAFRRATGLACFVELLADSPEFLPVLVHLRGKLAIAKELIAHGAVDALVRCVANARDSDVVCAGLEALGPLAATAGDLKPEQLAPLWPSVPELLHASEVSREATLHLLHCLSRKKGMAEPMVGSGAADWTLPLLESDEPSIQARALAILHRLAKMLPDVRNSGERLVTLLTAQDSAVRTGAVRALAELEQAGKIQLDVTQARQMFEAAGGLDKKNRVAALKALNSVALRCQQEKQAFSGTDAFYGQLMACLDAENDTLMRQIAAETLRVLAEHPEEKARIGKVPGAIDAFLKVLGNGERRITDSVLSCMANLAVLDDNKILLGTPQMLPAVVSLVKAPSVRVGCAAAALLRNLAVRTANSVYIGTLGGVEAVGDRAADLPPEYRINFLSALGNLAVDAGNAKKVFPSAHVMQMLIASLDPKHPNLAQQAARTLQNVSLEGPAKQAIFNAKGVVPLVQATMQRTNTSLTIQAMAALANLAVYGEAKKPIVDAFVAAVVPASGEEAVATSPVAETTGPTDGPPPGIRCLLEVIEGPNDDLASSAVAIIRDVVTNPDVQTSLAEYGFVPVLAAKLTNPHEPSCVAAAAALGNIAVNKTIRNTIGDEVLYKLIELLSHRSPKVHTTAAQALTVFAEDFRCSRILETARAVPRIIKLVG